MWSGEAHHNLLAEGVGFLAERAGASEATAEALRTTVDLAEGSLASSASKATRALEHSGPLGPPPLAPALAHGPVAAGSAATAAQGKEGGALLHGPRPTQPTAEKMLAEAHDANRVPQSTDADTAEVPASVPHPTISHRQVLQDGLHDAAQ